MHHRRPFLACVLIAFLTCGGSAIADEAPKSKESKPTPLDRLVAPMAWRSIGPANMGGRISSLAVYEKEPTRWWAATASGGLLKTVDNGITFEHQFDKESVVSIGDVAVCQADPKILWVGTGECNPRNSVSWGNGVYKSVDGGATWKHMGLERTFQISAVRIHPTNPDVVYVGACGRLWGPNEERGLYKTTDGGASWAKVHYVNEQTGVIDVQMHPQDPETLLIATYERQRDMFCTNDPAKKLGAGSGLYKTRDGGKTFTKLSEGLPTGHLGRVGIEYFRKNPDHVYAVVESATIGQEPPNAPFMGVNGSNAEAGARLTAITKDGPAAKAGLQKDDIVLAVNGKTVLSWAALLKEIRQHVAGDKVTVEIARDRKSVEIEFALGKRPKPKARKGAPRRPGGLRAPRSPYGAFLGGQQPNLQDQQGKAGHEHGGVFHSTDGGDTWTRINSLNPRPMYFSEIRVDPNDQNRIWVLGIRLWRSKDGGKTFTPDGHPRDVHVDHHALWIDPTNGKHLILGNDGGIYVSYDRGNRYDHLNQVAIGQFYDVGVGPRRDYRVYGGLQDNGSWGGPSRSARGPGPTNGDWIRIGGGDGFRVRVDPLDPEQIYFQSQNGNVGRRHLGTGSRGMMRPRAPRGEQYRFNWYTPYVLSHHNTRIYYTAGNRVFRSLNQGRGMRAISPDITATKRGSATALAESPRDPDVLYVGTDDGAFWMSKNGGHTWTDLYAQPARPETEPAPEPKPGPIASEGDASEGDASEGDAPEGESSDGEEEADAAEGKAKAQAPSQGEAQDAGERKATAGDGAPAKDTPKKRAAKKPKKVGPPLLRVQPDRRYVSWIEPSRHEAGRVYAVFDGHRSDDDRPLVFASEDHGTSWRSLADALPASAGTTRVLREDLVNPDVLYLGTEFGAYVTVDRGVTWTSLRTNLPTVAVHQFAQHPTAGEIVAATHGRSLWVLDVTPLRQMTKKVLDEKVHLFKPAEAVQWRPEPSVGRSRSFVGTNPPAGAQLWYRLGSKVAEATLEIQNADGSLVRTLEPKLDAGLHRIVWDLRMKPAPRRRVGRRVGAGTYTAVLTVGATSYKQPVVVARDPGHADSRWMAFQDAADERAAAKAKDRQQRHAPQSAGRDE